MARAWLKRGTLLLVDVLLPWFAGLVVARLLHPFSLAHLKENVLGHFGTYTPSDFGGTVWFYWWFHQAVSQGKTWLYTDAVCAPEGVPMGNNFPQWVDAALAYPFFATFDFPLNLNLFSYAIPIMGCAAAYYALRALFENRLLCLTLALIYGFNPYSYFELSRGRPVTAIVIVLPLFLGAWTMALKVQGWWRGLWILLAGAAGALSVYYYVLFAMLNAAFAGVTALYRTLSPYGGQPRYQAPLVALAVACLGVLFSMGYLHQIVVLQPRLPGRTVYSPQELRVQSIRPFWDPKLWGDLKAAGYGPSTIGQMRGKETAPALQEGWVIKSQQLSLPYYALFRARDFGGRPPEPYIPWIVSVLALSLGCLGGRRGWGWLGGALIYGSLTLGPYVCLETQQPYMEPLRVAGRLIPGPMQLLYTALPETTHFFWPYRAYPMALLCALCAMGAGITIGLERWKSRGPALGGHLAMGLIALLLLKGYFAVFQQARSHDIEFASLDTLSPFVRSLGDEEGASIIELPLGAGRLVAEFQLVHGQRRGDSHQDYLGSMGEEEVPPPECFKNSLTQGLWALGMLRQPEADLVRLLDRPGAPPQPPNQPKDKPIPPNAPAGYTYGPSLSREAFQDAVDAGFAYIIVHHQTYRALERTGTFISAEAVVRALTGIIGQPNYADSQVTAWDLRTLDMAVIPEGEPPLDLPKLGQGPRGDGQGSTPSGSRSPG